MKRVAIVQARMTSTRLPGKVLADVGGRPMLSQQIRRLRCCRNVDEIVIATTGNPSDEPVVELARREDVRWHRGSEHDVLSRFVGAANDAKADVVIRVTADCPLVDPQITDRVIRELADHSAACDYASNVVRRTYPRGLDVEALFTDVLQRINRLAVSQAAREHVTIIPRAEHRELFLVRSVEDGLDNSDLRWTVDTEADLRLMRLMYERLDIGNREVSYPEILGYVRQHADLSSMNAGIETWTPA